MCGLTVAKFAIIVDLTVVNDDITADPRHRLIAAFRQIDDAKTTMHEADIAGRTLPLIGIVGAPVSDHIAHNRQIAREPWNRLPAKINDTGYATHIMRSEAVRFMRSEAVHPNRARSLSLTTYRFVLVKRSSVVPNNYRYAAHDFSQNVSILVVGSQHNRYGRVIRVEATISRAIAVSWLTLCA